MLLLLIVLLRGEAPSGLIPKGGEEESLSYRPKLILLSLVDRNLLAYAQLKLFKADDLSYSTDNSLYL
jgi:hypothetical protein